MRMANNMLKHTVIEGFHVTSYQAIFASHHTRDRHVGYALSTRRYWENKIMFYYFLILSSSCLYLIIKLQQSDKNISTVA